MIRTLLIVLCLLLTGCAVPNQEAPLHPSEPPPVAVGAWEDRGSVRIFPLEGEPVRGIRSFGEGLLVFSGEEKTTLTLLTGENLKGTASRELDCLLDPWDCSLVLGEEGLSFYDYNARQTVLLDRSLQEQSCIPAPEGLVGVPFLSPEGDTLYYISGTVLRAWCPATGSTRCIKDFAGLHPTLAGIHLEGQVLECRLRDRTLFLDAEDGRILRELSEGITLESRGQCYWATLSAGMESLLVWGRREEAPRLLLPAGSPQSCFFLDETPGAVAVTTTGSGLFTLDYYDLEQGRRLSALSLASDPVPLAVEDTAAGGLYLLLDDPSGQGQTLYQWFPEEVPLQDPKEYTAPCAQDGTPVPQELAKCQALAETLEKKYGLGIKLWKEAVQTEPWDYQLEGEYQTALLYQSLLKLDRILANYPRKLLEETASHFTSLNLCLVREIRGSPESGSLNQATGVQFLSGTDAYVALAVGPYLEQALYHELFHAMETHILTNSTAFDRWDSLNPAGFQYDLDYQANAGRDSGVYLRQEHRAFVDTFSMSYPKEDRARIMEYAMLPGNETLFQPPKMQGKLKALCQGIRDAYGLENDPATYLWEQYLKK